eukprot:gene2989-1971_t
MHPLAYQKANTHLVSYATSKLNKLPQDNLAKQHASNKHTVLNKYPCNLAASQIHSNMQPTIQFTTPIAINSNNKPRKLISRPNQPKTMACSPQHKSTFQPIRKLTLKLNRRTTQSQTNYNHGINYSKSKHKQQKTYPTNQTIRVSCCMPTTHSYNHNHPIPATIMQNIEHPHNLQTPAEHFRNRFGSKFYRKQTNIDAQSTTNLPMYSTKPNKIQNNPNPTTATLLHQNSNIITNYLANPKNNNACQLPQNHPKLLLSSPQLTAAQPNPKFKEHIPDCTIHPQTSLTIKQSLQNSNHESPIKPNQHVTTCYYTHTRNHIVETHCLTPQANSNLPRISNLIAIPISENPRQINNHTDSRRSQTQSVTHTKPQGTAYQPINHNKINSQAALQTHVELKIPMLPKPKSYRVRYQ